MTATDVVVCKRKWEEIAELHKKMKCKIGLINMTLTEMAASSEKQKNIRMTVKDGIKHKEVYQTHR